MSLFDQWVVWSLPFMPKALVKRFADRYVAGEKIVDMLKTVRDLNRRGMMATVDVLGEFIHQREEAHQAAQIYKDILEAIHKERLNANISVKLSQMGLLLDLELCYEIMADLVATADRYGNFVRIDMENSACTSDTIDLYLKLRARFSNVGIVLQAYLRRTLQDVLHISETLERSGDTANFRLCKGIYIEPRTLAYRNHTLIHKNYTLLLQKMLERQAYVGIATHHEELVWEAMRLIDQFNLAKDTYEFQMLLGVDPELRHIILDAGHRLRVYVPFGKHWYAYCMRRLKENPSIAKHLLKNLFTPGDIRKKE